jgi:sec-independent protein translocase protein TatB
MFSSLGWGEVLALVVVALFVFGPDKLPRVARDAGRMLRQLREMANGARTQLKSELGPEFADLDFDSLNPRTFVRKHLFEDGNPLEDLQAEFRKPLLDPLADPLIDPVDDPVAPVSAPLRDGERPPFDPDAT